MKRRVRHTYECPDCGNVGLRQQPYCRICIQKENNNPKKFWTPDKVKILQELYLKHGCYYVAKKMSQLTI